MHPFSEIAEDYENAVRTEKARARNKNDSSIQVEENVLKKWIEYAKELRDLARIDLLENDMEV